MWRGDADIHTKVEELPFTTGNLLNFFEQYPLYFTGRQVKCLIEHLAPQLNLWAKELPKTTIYDCFHDACECDEHTMWDTIDTIFHLSLKFGTEETAKPSDAFECTAFHALQISKTCSEPDFLLDLPEDARPDGWNVTSTCLNAAVKLLIVAMVNLRQGNKFFQDLVGTTLPTPTSRYRVHIDNDPGHLNYAGTQISKGRQTSIRPKVEADEKP